jgi:hypothetical protein
MLRLLNSGIRLDQTTIDRALALAEARLDGTATTRSAVLRLAIERGLLELEQEARRLVRRPARRVH